MDDDSVDSCYTPAKSKANKGKKAKGTHKAETPNKETKCENFSKIYGALFDIFDGTCTRVYEWLYLNACV